MRRGLFYILRDKRVVRASMIEAAQWIEENRDERIVGQTHIGSVMVSTVFLGVDHAWGGGPPLVFETMVFSDGDEHGDFPTVRYSTYSAAERGHEKMVELVRRAMAKAAN